MLKPSWHVSSDGKQAPHCGQVKGIAVIVPERSPKRDKISGKEAGENLPNFGALLPWINSILLKGDVPKAGAELKAQQDSDIRLVVMGSGELIQTLRQHNLVDRYVLLIHPLLLGSGRRHFADGGAYAELQLVSAKATPTGVVVATYQTAEETAR